MSTPIRIRLFCPAQEEAKAFDPTFSSGGGFHWAEVEYEVNPVGSSNLYRITKCTRNGQEVDLYIIERNNYPDAVDEAIAAKIHGEYAKKNLKQDLEQLQMKMKPRAKEPKVDAKLDLGELFPV